MAIMQTWQPKTFLLQPLQFSHTSKKCPFYSPSFDYPAVINVLEVCSWMSLYRVRILIDSSKRQRQKPFLEINIYEIRKTVKCISAANKEKSRFSLTARMLHSKSKLLAFFTGTLCSGFSSPAHSIAYYVPLAFSSLFFFFLLFFSFISFKLV